MKLPDPDATRFFENLDHVEALVLYMRQNLQKIPDEKVREAFARVVGHLQGMQKGVEDLEREIVRFVRENPERWMKDRVN